MGAAARNRLKRLERLAARQAAEEPDDGRDRWDREFSRRDALGIATDRDWLWWWRKRLREGYFAPLPAGDVEPVLARYERHIIESESWPAEPPDDWMANFRDQPGWYPEDHREMERHFRQRSWECEPQRRMNDDFFALAELLEKAAALRAELLARAGAARQS